MKALWNKDTWFTSYSCLHQNLCESTQLLPGGQCTSQHQEFWNVWAGHTPQAQLSSTHRRGRSGNSQKQGCSSHPPGSKHVNSVIQGRFLLCATQLTFTYYTTEHRSISLHMHRTAHVETLNPEIHPASAPWMSGNICYTLWEISLLNILQQQTHTTYCGF